MTVNPANSAVTIARRRGLLITSGSMSFSSASASGSLGLLAAGLGEVEVGAAGVLSGPTIRLAMTKQ